jgi:hypothetical protein
VEELRLAERGAADDLDIALAELKEISRYPRHGIPRALAGSA